MDLYDYNPLEVLYEALLNMCQDKDNEKFVNIDNTLLHMLCNNYCSIKEPKSYSVKLLNNLCITVVSEAIGFDNRSYDVLMYDGMINLIVYKDFFNIIEAMSLPSYEIIGLSSYYDALRAIVEAFCMFYMPYAENVNLASTCYSNLRKLALVAIPVKILLEFNKNEKELKEDLNIKNDKLMQRIVNNSITHLLYGVV